MYGTMRQFSQLSNTSNIVQSNSEQTPVNCESQQFQLPTSVNHKSIKIVYLVSWSPVCGHRIPWFQAVAELL